MSQERGAGIEPAISRLAVWRCTDSAIPACWRAVTPSPGAATAIGLSRTTRVSAHLRHLRRHGRPEFRCLLRLHGDARLAGPHDAITTALFPCCPFRRPREEVPTDCLERCAPYASHLRSPRETRVSSSVPRPPSLWALSRRSDCAPPTLAFVQHASEPFGLASCRGCACDLLPRRAVCSRSWSPPPSDLVERTMGADRDDLALSQLGSLPLPRCRRIGALALVPQSVRIR